MKRRKQPDRKSKTRVVGEVQEPVLCDYQEVGSFTPRPFLKTEPVIVDPPQIKTEPQDYEVIPEVGFDPGCIKCKEEEGYSKKEPGLVKMEPVSPISNNSDTSTLPILPQEGELLRDNMFCLVCCVIQ